MAVETIRRGWQGRSLAHHARAMALYPTPYFQKVAALLKQARMGVVSDPHTGPLHARVRELLAENVLVCLGQDDISDAYYPFGRNNMLEVAFLASHLLWMTTAAEMETLYDMVTTRAAQAMGLPPPGGASRGLGPWRSALQPTWWCSTNPASSRRCATTRPRARSSTRGGRSPKDETSLIPPTPFSPRDGERRGRINSVLCARL